MHMCVCVYDPSEILQRCINKNHVLLAFQLVQVASTIQAALLPRPPNAESCNMGTTGQCPSLKACSSGHGKHSSWYLCLPKDPSSSLESLHPAGTRKRPASHQCSR